ncbi:SDR family NAD(P)-dependent oxidoreductase [Geodermatophilus sp. DF01_2]|uniref:SDR family NAD(P)-dependent oxidoreductase n=1 Tax=Geodermatophilus sp. DF01-2 TaxID=2559610 RepID=UPI001FD7A172|nr:SDR family NAD(P)-dependent oxidoreductase [Geodermatophilus sp. DF01_2]
MIAGSAALVTGASSGIGRAVAVELARRGAGRLLLGGRDRDALAEVAARTGGEPVPADLTSSDGLAATAAAARSVDLVVHAAGAGWAGDTAGMPVERLEAMLALNLGAPVELTRRLLPSMLARGSGHLVFVASIAGAVPVPGEVVYSATKGGLIAFADALRMEVGRRGVGVSVVLPGAVDTPFFARRGRRYDRSWPRMRGPEEVARSIVRAAEHGAAELVTPRWLRLPARLHGGAPALYRGLARWLA